MNKAELSLRVFITLVLLLFAFLLADLSLSYVTVCHKLANGVSCKLVPAIELVPTW